MPDVQLPATLTEWRRQKEWLGIWESFRPFFEQQGYKLFVPRGDSHVAPPELLGNRIPHSSFSANNPINFAARSNSGADVVVRLVQLAGEGGEFLDILRFLSSPAARVSANRTLPMIAEIHKNDMVFGVFPFMAPQGLSTKWFETTRELLDGLEQVFETFNFLHGNLIAHRDFSLDEVFLNYGSANAIVPEASCVHPRRPGPFRKFFDAQYYVNDFELSVRYSPSSDPASRLVVGHPLARYGYSIETYGKALPPEARLDEPYCPFKADIFQLGQDILSDFGRVTTLPGLIPLAECMTAVDPAQRPSMLEALAALRRIRAATPETLLDEMPKDTWYGYGWSLEELQQADESGSHEDTRSPHEARGGLPAAINKDVLGGCPSVLTKLDPKLEPRSSDRCEP